VLLKKCLTFFYIIDIYYRMQKIKNNTFPGEFDYQKSLKKSPDTLLNKFVRVERYINRPLASLIVRAVYKTRVTPNGLTYFSFFLGLLAAFFFSRGEYLYFILGGIFIQFSSIVDCADGMLARSKDMCSEYGSYLDLFLDRITDFAVIVSISVGISTAFNNKNLLILGLFTAGLNLLSVNLFYIANSYLQKKEKGETGEARALLLLLILIFSIANRLDILIYLLLAERVIANLSHVVVFIKLGRKKDEN
jgi:phosphatidylglycerophosphate synthase